MRILGRDVVCPFLFSRKLDGWSILAEGLASFRFKNWELKYHISRTAGSMNFTSYTLQRIVHNADGKKQYSEVSFCWRPDVTRYWWVQDSKRLKKGVTT